MLDNTKIFDKDTHGHFDFLEDEIDCAIAGDIKFDQVLDELEKINPSTDSNTELDSADDVIDPTIDYSESMPDVDSVSIDADELIDAERDICSNPLDEDEIIETVVDTDLIGDRGIVYKDLCENTSNNTYANILLESLSDKAKKRLKVGAAIAGTGAALYAAHKTGTLGTAAKVAGKAAKVVGKGVKNLAGKISPETLQSAKNGAAGAAASFAVGHALNKMVNAGEGGGEQANAEENDKKDK